MKKCIFAAVAATLCIGNSEAERQRFDLVCSGTYYEGPEKLAKPVERRLRVDLAAGKYCFDDCEKVRDIHAVQPDRIEFIKSEPGAEIFAEAVVSRTTGDYEHLILRGGGWNLRAEWKMQCDPAEFSGFPATRF